MSRRRVSAMLAAVLVAAGLATATIAAPAGAATYYGSAARASFPLPIVDMAAIASGHGYWLVTSDGRIFGYGDAHYYGSPGRLHLAKPIVGIAATPTGRGYWLVASDGGIFGYGDAHFYGSTGGTHLIQPIVDLARTTTGHGYWLVASDGGIFGFGDAHFHGSAAGHGLVEPIVDITRGPNGGYWLLSRDGSVFSYGARSYGSAAGHTAGQTTVAIAASPKNDGYWVATQWGGVDTGSASGMVTDPNLKPTNNEGAIASELIGRVNTERSARRSRMVGADPFLQSAASDWAHYLATTRQFEHQDLGKLMQKSGGKYALLAENLFGGSGGGAMDAGTAHVTLMHSDGHRSNILMPEERAVGVGAACINGMLIVVEDFGVPSGAAVS